MHIHDAYLNTSSNAYNIIEIRLIYLDSYIYKPNFNDGYIQFNG